MRILITGPECSGKSTLASELSSSSEIPWFPEYPRTYLEIHGPDYGKDDLLQIAKEYVNLVNAFPLDQNLILDTYLINLKIWSTFKYGDCHTWILEQMPIHRFDQVFLCSPIEPWVDDGLRENEHQVGLLFRLFQKELDSLGWPYVILEGDRKQRLIKAVEICKSK